LIIFSRTFKFVSSIIFSLQAIMTQDYGGI